MKKYIQIMAIAGLVSNLGLFASQIILQQPQAGERPAYWQRFKGTVGHYMPSWHYLPPALASAGLYTQAVRHYNPLLEIENIKWDAIKDDLPGVTYDKYITYINRGAAKKLRGMGYFDFYPKWDAYIEKKSHLVNPISIAVGSLGGAYLAKNYVLPKLRNYLGARQELEPINRTPTNYAYYAPGELAILMPYLYGLSARAGLIKATALGDFLAFAALLLGPAILGAGHLAHQYFNPPAIVPEEAEATSN